MLKSLFLSTTDPDSGALSRSELSELVGKLPASIKPKVARYLRTSPMVVPWMGITRDLLEGQFEVAGGTAVCSDGEYYWRLDTANYVETYGIGLASEFIEHARNRNWEPPQPEEEVYLEWCDEVMQISAEFPRAPKTRPSLQTFYPQRD